MKRLHCLAIAFLLGCGSGPQVAPAQPSAAHHDDSAADRKALARQLRAEREASVRERGEIFARIAVRHDYTGEYVLFRDQDVTAFLDIKDPRHPRHQPGRDEGEDSEGIDPKLLTHVLVVPNQPRETIGKTVASNITVEDLEATLKVMHAATELATRLGIKNARIYVRSPARIGIGYLHVHIIGERDPSVPLPPALQ